MLSTLQFLFDCNTSSKIELSSFKLHLLLSLYYIFPRQNEIISMEYGCGFVYQETQNIISNESNKIGYNDKMSINLKLKTRDNCMNKYFQYVCSVCMYSI